MKKIILTLLSVIIILVLAFSFVACDKEDTTNKELKFVVPDGTPALAICNLLGKTTIGDYSIDATIIGADTIATQIGGGKADLIIAPTNAGANLISKGADYKLFSVAVEGSLYLIGKPVSEGNNVITLNDIKGKTIASIGHNNTPDRVFKFIIDNTDGVTYDDQKDTITFADGSVTTIEWAADGPAAKTKLLREENPCDFAIVGEPAATAFGTPNGGGFSARMDLQAMYKKCANTTLNFPQASLFVKTSLLNDTAFMSALVEKLKESREWVIANPTDVSAKMKDLGSATAFPAPSIARCNVVVSIANTAEVKASVITYLKLMVPAVDWDNVNLF